MKFRGKPPDFGSNLALPSLAVSFLIVGKGTGSSTLIADHFGSQLAKANPVSITFVSLLTGERKWIERKNANSLQN
jgi:hypothetical protein